MKISEKDAFSGLSFVKEIALVFKRRYSYMDVDDFVAAGVDALFGLWKRYKSGNGNQFEKYADKRIRGAMLDEIIKQDKTPCSVRKKNKKLNEVKSSLRAKLMREPEIEDVCCELKITLKAFWRYQKYSTPYVFFPFDESVDSQIIEMSDILERVYRKELQKIFMPAIRDLPNNEQIVILLYYFHGFTLKEVGLLLQVDESRACRIHAKAISILRKKIKSDSLYIN